MRQFHRFAIPLSVMLVVGSISAGDKVTLVNDSGHDNGVMTWGKGAGTPNVGPSPVYVGSIKKGTHNQVLSFTKGRPPGLNADVKWGPGDVDIKLEYPNPYEIPIKIWILCADPTCHGVSADKQLALGEFLVLANETLLAERTGMVLTMADGVEWISDQTSLASADAELIRKFKRSKCGDLESAATKLHIYKERALNVYMAQTVDSEPGDGYQCPQTDDMVVVGYLAKPGTILHEVGHAFSLKDIDSQPWFIDVGGYQNVMCEFSTDRRYLSEGQIFRMHFEENSALNSKLTGIPSTLSGRRVRSCSNLMGAPPCPEEKTLLWTQP